MIQKDDFVLKFCHLPSKNNLHYIKLKYDISKLFYLFLEVTFCKLILNIYISHG